MVGRAVDVTVVSRAESNVAMQSGGKIIQKRQPRDPGCSSGEGEPFEGDSAGWIGASPLACNASFGAMVWSVPSPSSCIGSTSCDCWCPCMDIATRCLERSQSVNRWCYADGTEFDSSEFDWSEFRLLLPKEVKSLGYKQHTNASSRTLLAISVRLHVTFGVGRWSVGHAF